MREVTAVLLGDSGVGKSALASRLQGTQPSVEYHPTVGADLVRFEVSLLGETVALSIWDMPGNERYLSRLGGALVEADLCILVCDLTCLSTLEHLGAWHDEFLQSSQPKLVPPGFIVVGNKKDLDRQEITSSALVGWIADESIHPCLWSKEVMSNMEPVAAPCEVSSRTDEGITELLTSILHRGLLLQSLEKHLAQQFQRSTFLKVPTQFSGIPMIRCALLGDSCESFSDRLLNQVTPRAESSWHFSDAGAYEFEISADDRKDGTTSFICRGAHCCIITLRLGPNAPVHRIPLMKEVFLRDSCYRELYSPCWIVVGIRAPDYFGDATHEAASYCEKNNCVFIDVTESPTADFVHKTWQKIGNVSEQHRMSLILQRTEDQIGNFVAHCPNQEKGCKWTGKNSDLHAHASCCPLNIISCRFDGCGQQITLSEREHHEKFCAHRPAMCHFCESAYATSLHEHLLICPKRKDFENTTVPCPLADFGCVEHHLKRSEVSKHIQSESATHVELLATALTYIRRDMLEREGRYHREMQQEMESRRAETQSFKEEITKCDRRISEQQNKILDLQMQLDELNSVKK